MAFHWWLGNDNNFHGVAFNTPTITLDSIFELYNANGSTPPGGEAFWIREEYSENILNGYDELVSFILDHAINTDQYLNARQAIFGSLRNLGVMTW